MVDRAARGGGVATSLVPTFASQGQSVAGLADWFGPGSPMNPTAPAVITGRGLDFQPNVNMVQTPKYFEGISFKMLRNLSRSYDILRLVIETRKDQMASLNWAIRPRDKNVKIEGDVAERVKLATEFFQMPDKEHDWDTWLRMVLEDLLVLDAPAIYARRTRSGALYGLKPMDGATFKRVIDDWGDTPRPPYAAYQQVLRGLPALNYTTRQIIYRPRNPSTDRIYGFGPVEQIVATVNLGLRREAWQINYFAESNIPDTLIGMPADWTGDQIRAFQTWFDAALSGNMARRSGAIFVPGGSAKNIHEARPTELVGAAEEWLARVVCYAFGVSPQGFVKMMNRASGETQQELSQEEGLEPQKQWVSSLINFVLRTYFNSPDLEHVWPEETAIDPEVEDKIIQAQTDSGRMTLNEARKAKGQDPYSIPEANVPMIKTSTGYSPIGLEDAVARAKAMAEAMPKLGQPVDDEGDGDESEDEKDTPPAKPKLKPGEQKAAIRSFSVAKADEDPLSQTRPLNRRVEKAIARIVQAAFDEVADDVAAQVSKALKVATKAESEDVDLDALVAGLDISAIEDIADDVASELEEVAKDTAARSLAMVGVDKASDLFNVVNERAVLFARDRAAELVGKQWTADGRLIDNPNPKWAITETTRNMIREVIAQGLADNIGTPAIAKAIQESTAFSKSRSKMIAEFETSNANEQSKLMGWREAGTVGVTVKKKWLTAGAEVCEICLANQAEGFIALTANFQSGHDAAPAHPRCRCVIISEVQ